MTRLGCFHSQPQKGLFQRNAYNLECFVADLLNVLHLF